MVLPCAATPWPGCSTHYENNYFKTQRSHTHTPAGYLQWAHTSTSTAAHHERLYNLLSQTTPQHVGFMTGLRRTQRSSWVNVWINCDFDPNVISGCFSSLTSARFSIPCCTKRYFRVDSLLVAPNVISVFSSSLTSARFRAPSCIKRYFPHKNMADALTDRNTISVFQNIYSLGR
jgi:hypothetical protein